ncbi:reverse transcriptase domain-containing protein [Tanacetum coccineum]
MPPRMMTRSAGRPAATSRGGGTGERTGRGGGRTGGRSGNQGNGRNDGQGGQVGGQGREVNDCVDGIPDFSTIIAQQLQNLLPVIVAQVGNQGIGQGNGRNQNGDAINDNILGNVRNVIENNDRRGCTYKEFLACNPNEYDGKGGMSWDNFKVLTREEFCPSNEMQKLETELWNHVMVGAGHAAYTDRFHELARLVPHLVTPKTEGLRGMGQPKRTMRREEMGDNLVRIGMEGMITKGLGLEMLFLQPRTLLGEKTRDAVLKCTTCNFHHSPETPCRTCFNFNRPGHFAKDCRVVPSNVNHINARNLTVRAYYKCGSTYHVKAACHKLNQAQRPGETIKTKLWLLMGIKVVGTMVTRHMEGHLCWEHRRLART